jgi:amino acid transporter
MTYSTIPLIGDYDNAAIAVIVQVCPYVMQVTLVWLVTAAVLGTGVTGVTTSARITYALVRDRIVPSQEYLAYIHPETQAPVYCVIVVFVAVFVLLLLPLVNEAAFYSFCSMCAFGLYVSYAIPIGLKLFSADRASFPYGPVNFGSWTIYMEIISFLFLSIMSIVLLFPYSYPVTADNMNYSIVIISGLGLIMYLAWEFGNKHTFKGPVRHAAYRNIDAPSSGIEEQQHRHNNGAGGDHAGEGEEETDQLIRGNNGRKDR